MTLETRNRRPEAGFALLIAVIFMSVMLAFGLALGSLAYKQQILSSSARQSHYAFYAADAALECALYADQKQGLFAYKSEPEGAPTMTCEGLPATSDLLFRDAERWVISQRVSLNEDTACADVTISKPSGAGAHFIFSQGYDVSCAVVADPQGARFVARGINVRY